MVCARAECSDTPILTGGEVDVNITERRSKAPHDLRSSGPESCRVQMHRRHVVRFRARVCSICSIRASELSGLSSGGLSPSSVGRRPGPCGHSPACTSAPT